MGEGDAEATAAPFARFIVEAGLVALAQLTGDIQAEAGAFVLGGVEGLEDMLLLFGRHAGAVVENLQYRQVAFRIAEQAQSELAEPVLLGAVAQAVLYQIGQYLGQLVWIHARLQAAALGLQVDLSVSRCRAAKFAGEAV